MFSIQQTDRERERLVTLIVVVFVLTCEYKAKLKIPVFRVTQPYLDLLVKPGIFSGFLKNII